MPELPRHSGLLLHVTSLPSRYGVGDFGPTAYAFVDFLVQSGQRVWQVLPLVPVTEGASPYASPSTFAGSPLLISPDQLAAEGLLTADDVAQVPDFPADHVAYETVTPFKRTLLERAYAHHAAAPEAERQQRFEAFCAAERGWLDDYALFRVLKEAHDGEVWTRWAAPLAACDPQAVAQARQDHAEAIRQQQFWQFLFAEQWQALKHYANERGVLLFGDLPIYVAHDSADVWAAQHLFHLEDDGEPVVVAGVPPDYFSATGQRWGNPIYRWDVMRKDRYAWWTRRLRHILQQVDLLRLDHFRAFEAYWAIPRAEETAVNGAWYPGPGAPFFETIRENLGSLDFVAEDLGIITDEVRALMRQFGLPGMAVLQFAFGGDDAHPFLPHNFHEHLVAYTGTHDNDTFAGWWFDRASTQEAEVVANEQARIRTYLHLTPEREAMIHWVGIETLMRSQARLVVFPLQDVLGLRSEARMNTPGTDHGNWAWRVQPDALTPEHGATLRRLAEESGRV